MVPTEFTVPDSEPWPENTRGMPLGRSVQKIRTKAFLEANPEAEEKLRKIDFQLDSKAAANDIRFQNVYNALQRYKEIYGDLLVPQPFEIPTDSEDWPEATWGIRLGARVNAIRSQGTFVKTDPARREQLDQLGFVWSPPESERRKRGRKSKAEIESAAQELFDATVNASQKPESQEDDDLDSFVASFDFSGTDSSEASSSSDSISPTWGFEGGPEFQNMITVAKEEAAQQAAKEDYVPPRTLEESLREAQQRAVEVGIVQEG